MKKVTTVILSLVLVIVLSVSFTGCVEDDDGDDNYKDAEDFIGTWYTVEFDGEPIEEDETVLEVMFEFRDDGTGTTNWTRIFLEMAEEEFEWEIYDDKIRFRFEDEDEWGDWEHYEFSNGRDSLKIYFEEATIVMEKDDDEDLNPSVIVDLEDKQAGAEYKDEVTIYKNGQTLGYMEFGESKEFNFFSGAYNITVMAMTNTDDRVPTWRTEVTVEVGEIVTADDWEEAPRNDDEEDYRAPPLQIQHAEGTYDDTDDEVEEIRFVVTLIEGMSPYNLNNLMIQINGEDFSERHTEDGEGENIGAFSLDLLVGSEPANELTRDDMVEITIDEPNGLADADTNEALTIQLMAAEGSPPTLFETVTPAEWPDPDGDFELP